MTTVAVLEQRVNNLETTLTELLGLSRATLEIATTLSQTVGSLADTVNTRLGYSTSMSVFDALDEFRDRLERIENKLSI